MKRISHGLFKNRARKPKNKDTDHNSRDEDIHDEDNHEDGQLSSTYSMNSSGGPKTKIGRMSAGLFHKKKKKKDDRKGSGTSTGNTKRTDDLMTDEDDLEDPEKVYDEDDVSDNSSDSASMQRPVAESPEDHGMGDSSDDDNDYSFDGPSKPKRNITPRWSVAPDMAISNTAKSFETSKRSIDCFDEIAEGDEDDSDVYTSDAEEDDNGNGGVVPEGKTQDETIIDESSSQKTPVVITAPTSPEPSTTSHSEEVKPKPKKKKKAKGGGGTSPLDDHLAKTKKKKKKNGASSGSVSSKKSTMSTKSNKSTKSKKTKTKKKKTLDTIESSPKPKSPKSTTKPVVTTTSAEDDIPVGDTPTKKRASLLVSPKALKDKIKSSLSPVKMLGPRKKVPLPPLSDDEASESDDDDDIFLEDDAPTDTNTPPTDDAPTDTNAPATTDDAPTTTTTTGPPQKPEDIDAKAIKADAVSRIRAFGMMLGRINDQKEFLAAFNETDSDDDVEEDKNKPTMTRKEKKKEGKRFSSLLTELQNYELTLEKERTEFSQERYELGMKQESLELLLSEESEKNAELESQVEELREQLDHGLGLSQLEELKDRNLTLEAENELLQQKNERHEQTIAALVKEAESGLKRTASGGPYQDRALMRAESTRWAKSKQEACSDDEGGFMELTDDDADAIGDDGAGLNGNQSGFNSMSSLSGKAKGELLQLRSSLKNKDSALEQQAKEIASLQQALETLRDERHVREMTQYVENLENEKKFFVSEIDKLKKELDVTKKREREAAKAALIATSRASQSASESNNSGWFGFGGGGNEENKDENKSDDMDSLTLSGASQKKPTRRVSSDGWGLEDLHDKPKSLEDVLDF
mmetsp:Transcript_13057/g.30898  ORF Transcript_13057/g.30898 Transcript_13057/m.30898 type:complete len:862 (-) Transcript_13057:288-2873(-)